jgi:hypothetical protein
MWTARGEGVEDLLPLLGERAVLLTATEEEPALEGDLDFAVTQMDPMWPLRADRPWRLCQCIRYDLTGWHWILERDGGIVAIDTLDDPNGIGQYGFPTSLIRGDTIEPGILAAYLTSKRIRKAGRWNDVYETTRPFAAEWQRIRAMAAGDESRFRRTLDVVFGRGLAHQVAASVLAGVPPTPALRRRARVTLLARRFRTTARIARGVHAGASRWLGRMLAPTGLVVTIVGPDGSGKSTLSRTLPEACRGLFRRHARLHWRPGVLPRPGAIVGTGEADTSRPHGRPTHGRTLSLCLLAYYWLDFLVGGYAKVWPVKVRSGLVLLERGWADIAVDPRRYRLDVSPAIVRALGRLLPRPDMTVVLDANPEVIRHRKPELTAEESERQRREWRERPPSGSRASFVDASRMPDAVVHDARNAIVRHLEARAVGRLGPGWAGLPPGRHRWWIPRRSKEVARSALRIHQPMTPSGRIVWDAARFVAGLGGFAALPRGAAPWGTARELLAPFIPRGATFALGQANHHGRFFALIIGSDGRRLAWAKLATDAAGCDALAYEADAIATFAPLLPAPVCPPRLLERHDGVLLFAPAEWILRSRPWEFPQEVAHALGRFFRAGATQGRQMGMGHGDVAPWNLLRTADGWVLADWESASESHPPFFDPLHYAVQGHALLGRPSERELIAAISGEGPLGAALAAYADGASLDMRDLPTAFRNYVEASREMLDPATPDGSRGIRSRLRLLSRMG